ncbi:hypothetical protein SAMN02745194_03153 [Roseomonas rosea]|uniref:Uncharacterized protein n=1 Tax=Muricoccus roseus TaxID=198092 RepID=A0A1M6LEZ0_9PROT|nr:hypothetical protein [Roseomonas rosea]SHJ69783.1 hypothetical protein SAMN02745194_03153 [Roseomonas rosea]
MPELISALAAQAQAYATELLFTLALAAAGAVWRSLKRAALDKAAALKARAEAAEAEEREKASALDRLAAMGLRAGLQLLAVIQEDPQAAEKIAAAEAKLSADLAAAGRHALDLLKSTNPAEIRNLVLGSTQQLIEERARTAIGAGLNPAEVTGALSGALTRLRGLAG